MRRTAMTWGAAALSFLALSSTAGAASWRPEPATYGVAALHNLPVRMTDGTVLRADVDVPVPPGHSAPAPGLRFPTLVEQTAYYKDGPIAKTPTYFVQRGYAVVLADVRGTGSSEGEWQMLGPLEQQDGVQVIHWAASQPWSDGRIGLLGGSYSGINQLLIMERPDAPREVRAILPLSPMADPYRDVAFPGGAFDAEFMGQWLGLTEAGSLAPAQQWTSGDPEAATVAAQHVAGAEIPATVVADALSGGPLAYDGPFWQDRAPLAHIDRIRVPTMIVGGEFDIFQRGLPLLFQKLRVADRRLILGPWVHGNAGSTLPADGIPDRQTLELELYDQYVRGEQTDIASLPRVEQYRLEGSAPSHFVASAGWPLPGVHALDLYLGAGPSGTARSVNDGTLGATRPSSAGEDPLPYEPAGTPCTRETFQWGAQSSANDESSSRLPCEGDQRVDEAQDLTYTTPPLRTPLTVDGPIDLHLVARSPLSRDTVFSATLTDVAPDGTSVALTGGWLVASQRRTVPSDVDMSADGQPLRVFHPFTAASAQTPPATPAAYDVEVFPTFATVLPGHRLRLDIGTGQLPHMTPTATEGAAAAGGLFLVDRSPSGDTSRLILPQVGS